MADEPPIPTGVFHRPFDEQLAFFRRKLGHLVPTSAWDDLLEAEHDHAFMVAGATKADLLQDLASAVEKAISDGVGFEEFQKDFESIVAKHGWTGWTGESTPAGRRWRARVIYQTNTQVSYSAGRLAQLRAANFKFWVYHHSEGEMDPRPLHVSWDGLVLPPDHPFWRTHYPPSAWGCRCYVVGARSEAGARRLDGDPGKQLPADWNKIDPTTGEPMGIDKGWGYMPGDTVAQTVHDMAYKIQRWDYSLAKAYMQSVPEGTRDALAVSYRELPSTATDTRRYVQRVLSPNTTADVPPYQTLGLATSEQSSAINGMKKGLDVTGYDFTLDPVGIKHVDLHHGDIDTEAARGQQAVTLDDFALLPAAINSEDQKMSYAGVIRGTGLPGIRIVSRINDKSFVTVWELRARRKMLTLRSFFIGSGKQKP